MPTLLDQGRPVADPWTAVADAEPIPAAGPVILPVARWQAERDALAGRTDPLGVAVPGDTKVETLAADLPRLALVAIHFPKFRDGRGFTLARALREHHAFAGEIRATGHVLPDQYQHLVRCGFSTVVVPDGANLDTWARALGELSVVYQHAVREASGFTPLHRYLAAD